MRHIILLIAIALNPVQLLAQDTASIKAEKIYRYAEKMPEPPFNVYEYLSDNVKYPDKAAKAGIEGRVAVQFVIAEDGAITNARIFKAVHPLLDEEALRVVNAMPKWTPGSQNGKAVKVLYTLPITFKLDKKRSKK